MKLYLVRHGQTDANKEKINRGQSDCPLNDEGRVQAAKVAERLKNETFDVVIVSDLPRTRETAEIILAHHENKPHFDERAREMHMGVFEGKPYGSLSSHIKENNLNFFSFRPEGGESRNDFKKRIVALFEEITEQYKGKKVLLVTHGGFIRNLFLHIEKKEDKNEEYGTHNCSLSIFNVDKEVEVDLYNCTKHFEQ